MAIRSLVFPMVLVFDFHVILAGKQDINLKTFRCPKSLQKCNRINPHLYYYACKQTTLTDIIPSSSRLQGDSLSHADKQKRRLCSDVNVRRALQFEIRFKPLTKFKPSDQCSAQEVLEVSVGSDRKIANISVTAFGSLRWNIESSPAPDLLMVSRVKFRPYHGQNVTIRMLLEELGSPPTLVECLIPIRKECQSHETYELCNRSSLSSKRETEEKDAKDRNMQETSLVTVDPSEQDEGLEEGKPSSYALFVLPGFAIGAVISAMVALAIKKCRSKKEIVINAPGKNQLDIRNGVQVQEQCQGSASDKAYGKLHMESKPTEEVPHNNASQKPKQMSHASNHQKRIHNRSDRKQEFVDKDSCRHSHSENKQVVPKLPRRNNEDEYLKPVVTMKDDEYIDPDPPLRDLGHEATDSLIKGDEYVQPDPPLKDDKNMDPGPPLKDDENVQPITPLKDGEYVYPDSLVKDGEYVDPDPPLKDGEYVDPDPPLKDDEYVDPDTPLKDDEDVGPDPPLKDYENENPDPPLKHDVYLDPDKPLKDDEYVDPDSPLKDDEYHGLNKAYTNAVESEYQELLKPKEVKLHCEESSWDDEMYTHLMDEPNLNVDS